MMWSEVEARQGAYDWSGYDPVIQGLQGAPHRDPADALHDARLGQRRPADELGADERRDLRRLRAPRRAALPVGQALADLERAEPAALARSRPIPPSYVKRLLNPAYAAIHKARPGALVAGGVTAPRAATGGVSPVAWIDGMAAAGAHLDAYAHNPYCAQQAPRRRSPAAAITATRSRWRRSTGSLRDVGRAFGPGKRIWLTEFGYQTNPPDPYLGVSRAKQALYIGEAALRAYLAPKVDMLIQFLIQDEPEIDRWQSGVLTAQREA